MWMLLQIGGLTLEAITRRLKQDKRGVSNVIVVMLSLVLIVIIVGNVVLWSYQMNQLDWEKMQEDAKITDITSVNSSPWFTVQREYVVDTGSRTNGTFIDTQAIDDQYERFTEGSNWWNTSYSYKRQITIANNAASTGNVGYSVCVTINTASLVSAGKMLLSGNDLRVVYWSNSNWNELDREVIGMNNTSTQVWFKTQATIEANSSDSNYYIYYGDPSAGSPPANRNNVYLWYDDFDRADKPDITTEASYSVKTGGGVWSIETDKLKNVGAAGDPNKLVITGLGNVDDDIDMLVKINAGSFAGGDLSRMGLSCCINTNPSSGSGYCGLFHQNTNTLDLLNDLRSWGTQGTYGWSLNTWYYMRFRVLDPASKLGKIKVWQVGTSEPDIWTVDGNFGVGTARSYGEVGFAGSRTTDTTYFDDILIRYIMSPEPLTSLGTEESQGDNRLDIDGAFVIDTFSYPLNYIQTVEMQLKFRSSDTGENWYLKAYNWTSSTYSDSGFNSTTGYTPTTEWDYYTVNLTDQWHSYVYGNGTVYAKIVDEGVDGNQSIIDIDFFAVRLVINGTKFTFQNRGSSTSHLVSLWVTNSTNHLRYDMNTFISSGDSVSYIRDDISLQNTSCIVKVVTERGNIAVFINN
jgi:hypothetical protein